MSMPEAVPRGLTTQSCVESLFENGLRSLLTLNGVGLFRQRSSEDRKTVIWKASFGGLAPTSRDCLAIL